jgi:hypothetical protein
MGDELATVRAAMAQSDLAHAAESVRLDGGCLFALGNSKVRPLTREEIARLESFANSAEDWTRVRVAEEFDCSRIRHASFHGDVVLGRFADDVTVEEGIHLPAGIYASTLANCVVGHNALVRDVKLLANYVVGADAILCNCANVTCAPATTFGNGQSLSLGQPSGGHEVPIYAEISLPVAAALACGPSRHDLWQSFARLVADYLGTVASNRGIIEAGAFLRNTPNVHNCYIGRHARVDGATLVTDSTLLSCQLEPAQVLSGACVSHSILQRGSQVATLAIVERSVLMEHARVEQHGKLTASILGPLTSVADGEVATSLLGPSIEFQHQALLVAALWPEGKGKVSHGVHVGSHYSDRTRDQKFRLAEGMHLGLGVRIKSPADFSRSPYSIIACGVSALPQHVTFPFALIHSPSARWEGVAPTYNEIVPAWVLTNDLYALKRLESRTARNQTRGLRLELDVFRLEIIDYMADAHRRLQSITLVKDFYTEMDIPGLGKNVLLEAHRWRAIDAYQFFGKYYALLCLKGRVHGALQGLQDMHGRIHGTARGWKKHVLSSLLETPSDEPCWEYQRRMIQETWGDVATALGQMPELLNSFAQTVERTRAESDDRGLHIEDAHADAHLPVSRDRVVQQTWRETRRMQQEVGLLLDKLALQELSGGASD